MGLTVEPTGTIPQETKVETFEIQGHTSRQGGEVVEAQGDLVHLLDTGKLVGSYDFPESGPFGRAAEWIEDNMTSAEILAIAGDLLKSISPALCNVIASGSAIIPAAEDKLNDLAGEFGYDCMAARFLLGRPPVDAIGSCLGLNTFIKVNNAVSSYGLSLL